MEEPKPAEKQAVTSPQTVRTVNASDVASQLKSMQTQDEPMTSRRTATDIKEEPIPAVESQCNVLEPIQTSQLGLVESKIPAKEAVVSSVGASGKQKPATAANEVQKNVGNTPERRLPVLLREIDKSNILEDRLRSSPRCDVTPKSRSETKQRPQRKSSVPTSGVKSRRKLRLTSDKVEINSRVAAASPKAEVGKDRRVSILSSQDKFVTCLTSPLSSAPDPRLLANTPQCCLQPFIRLQRTESTVSAP